MDFELTEEQKMLKDTVARFVEKEITPRAAEWDEQEAFPSEVFRAMGDLGLFGISIPEAYGGSGADFLSCVLIHAGDPRRNRHRGAGCPPDGVLGGDPGRPG